MRPHAGRGGGRKSTFWYMTKKKTVTHAVFQCGDYSIVALIWENTPTHVLIRFHYRKRSVVSYTSLIPFVGTIGVLHQKVPPEKIFSVRVPTGPFSSQNVALSQFTLSSDILKNQSSSSEVRLVESICADKYLKGIQENNQWCQYTVFNTFENTKLEDLC